MLTKKQKLRYLLDSILASGQRVRCTFCKGEDCIEVDRKYLVTRLMECQNCHLYFRYPIDKKKDNTDFYQTEYQESDKITTSLPDAILLEEMKRNGFRLGGKNADRHLELFATLFPSEKSLRIIDYGSSWGYTTYQFKKAGHQVQGYEISKSRANYGNKNLGIDISTDEKKLMGENHIFFSSHVIEHHPDIAAMVNLAESLCMDGGYFIALCPNGSPAFRKKNPETFHRFWGKVHPNYLNGEFFRQLFKNRPYYIGSSPIAIENIYPLQMQQLVMDELSGEELMVISKFVKS
jgi:hypothetical protein